MHAVILVGGLGTRLGELTKDTPKPMVEVPGTKKPILEFVVEGFKAGGITDYIFMESFMAHKIQDHFGDGHKFGININHVELPLESGVAGAMRKGVENVPEDETNAIIALGDVVSNVDYKALVARHEQAWERGFQPIITGVARPGRYGSFHSDGIYSTFTEKEPENLGIMCVNREWFIKIAPQTGSIEFMKDLPYGDIQNPYLHEGVFVDAGVPEDLALLGKMYSARGRIENRG